MILTLEQKKSLITRHPCFAKLTSNELDQFAALFTQKEYPAGKNIVKENNLIKSVFLVVSGTAEVSQASAIPVATLTTGDAIGLSDSGFYSTTGRRTATVTAITDMTLLRIKLSAFYEFANANPNINDVMRHNAELMLKINLIKHATPFAKLSFENIRWLAEQVRTIFVDKDKIIFQKEDPADHCYLIESGKVEVFIPETDGSETLLATLKSPAIFGEAGLLLDTPRNASARAIDHCKLLQLDRESLLHVVKSEQDTATSLMTLLHNRSRPQQLPHIEHFTHETADKETVITLKDEKKGNYYRLSEEGWFIWQLLDGKNTLRMITLAFKEQYDVFDPGMISDFILDLEESGFIEKNSISHEESSANQPRWMKAMATIRKVMEASVSFGHVDNWLSKSYQQVFRYLYTPPALLIMTLLILFGISTFLTTFSHHVELLRLTHHSSWLVIFAITASMSTVILHELAHAYTTKAFGYKVKSFGIGWFWLGPMAFCDTSDMWLSTKWPRIAVDLSGLYTDLLTGGFAAIIAYFTTDPTLSLFFWLIALFNYLSIFTNLSPTLELDGYYTLMDLFNKDNLRESAIVWLANDASTCFHNPKLFLKNKTEAIYWLLCFIYLIPQIIIPYVVMNLLLAGLLGVKNPYFALAFPLIIITISSLGIWSKVKNQRN